MSNKRQLKAQRRLAGLCVICGDKRTSNTKSVDKCLDCYADFCRKRFESLARTVDMTSTPKQPLAGQTQTDAVDLTGRGNGPAQADATTGYKRHRMATSPPASSPPAKRASHSDSDTSSTSSRPAAAAPTRAAPKTSDSDTVAVQPQPQQTPPVAPQAVSAQAPAAAAAASSAKSPVDLPASPQDTVPAAAAPVESTRADATKMSDITAPLLPPVRPVHYALERDSDGLLAAGELSPATALSVAATAIMRNARTQWPMLCVQRTRRVWDRAHSPDCTLFVVTHGNPATPTRLLRIATSALTRADVAALRVFAPKSDARSTAPTRITIVGDGTATIPIPPGPVPAIPENLTLETYTAFATAWVMYESNVRMSLLSHLMASILADCDDLPTARALQIDRVYEVYYTR